MFDEKRELCEQDLESVVAGGSNIFDPWQNAPDPPRGRVGGKGGKPFGF